MFGYGNNATPNHVSVASKKNSGTSAVQLLVQYKDQIHLQNTVLVKHLIIFKKT